MGITRIGSRAKHLEFAIYSTIGSSHKIELYFNEPHPKKANSHLTLFGSFQLHWNYLNTISVGRIKLTLKRRKPRKRKPDFGLDQLGTERGFVRVAVTATLWKGRLLRCKLRIVLMSILVGVMMGILMGISLIRILEYLKIGVEIVCNTCKGD